MAFSAENTIAKFVKVTFWQILAISKSAKLSTTSRELLKICQNRKIATQKMWVIAVFAFPTSLLRRSTLLSHTLLTLLLQLLMLSVAFMCLSLAAPVKFCTGAVLTLPGCYVWLGHMPKPFGTNLEHAHRRPHRFAVLRGFQGEIWSEWCNRRANRVLT